MNKSTKYRRKAHEDLQEIQSLPNGWDYGEGFGGSEIAVESAYLLLEELASKKFHHLLVKVFPQHNGGITFHIWENPSIVAEIRISPDTYNSFDIAEEREVNGNIEIPDEKTKLNLQQILKELSRIFLLWTSSEHLIHNEHITKTYNDLHQTVSETTKAVFLFSLNNAPNNIHQTYVSTSKIIINQQSVTQSNTGYSIRKFSSSLQKITN